MIEKLTVAMLAGCSSAVFDGGSGTVFAPNHKIIHHLQVENIHGFLLRLHHLRQWLSLPFLRFLLILSILRCYSIRQSPLYCPSASASTRTSNKTQSINQLIRAQTIREFTCNQAVGCSASSQMRSAVGILFAGRIAMRDW